MNLSASNLWLIAIFLSCAGGAMGPILTGKLPPGNSVDIYIFITSSGLGLLAIAGIPAFLIRMVFRKHFRDERNFLLLLIFLLLVFGILITMGHLYNHQQGLE